MAKSSGESKGVCPLVWTQVRQRVQPGVTMAAHGGDRVNALVLREGGGDDDDDDDDDGEAGAGWTAMTAMMFRWGRVGLSTFPMSSQICSYNHSIVFWSLRFFGLGRDGCSQIAYIHGPNYKKNGDEETVMDK